MATRSNSERTPAYERILRVFADVRPCEGATSLIQVLKVAENSSTLSIHNTARQMLWLPTTKEMLYQAKPTVDTLFVRLGDGLAAVTILVGTRVFDLGNMINGSRPQSTRPPASSLKTVDTPCTGPGNAPCTGRSAPGCESPSSCPCSGPVLSYIRKA
jgi:hypothetical protein